MNKTTLLFSRIAFSVLITLLLTVNVAHGQPKSPPKSPQITAVSRTQNADGTLVVTVVGDQSLLLYLENSKLLYKLIGSAIATPVGFQLQKGTGNAGNPNVLTFSVPGSSLQNADEVEYYVQINNSSGNILAESAHYQLDLLAKRELSAAVTEKERFKGEAERQAIQIKELLAQTISPPPPNLAEIISISDTEARFRFTTPKFGKIRVELIRDDNNSLIDAWTSPDLSKDHAVILKGMIGGKTYRVQAWVLNHLIGDAYDKANPQLTSALNSALKFSAPDRVDPPVLQVLPITKTSNSITVPVNLTDGFINVNLEVLTDPISEKYKKVDSRGNLRVDQFGRVAGDKVEPSYTFAPLSSNTRYRLTFQAINSAGKSLVSPETFNQIVTTLAETPFEFAGGINLDISPLTGFTATWEATSAPDGGSFEVVFGQETPITSQPATVSGNKLTASLPVNELQNLYSKIKGNKKKIEPPTLTFKMRNKNNVQKQSTMTVAFTLPDKPQLEEAKAKKIINDDEMKQILQVVKGATDGKSGFKWQDLLSTGLGILLRVLIP
jgi:hypothetical protein